MPGAQAIVWLAMQAGNKCTGHLHAANASLSRLAVIYDAPRADTLSCPAVRDVVWSPLMRPLMDNEMPMYSHGRITPDELSRLR